MIQVCSAAGCRCCRNWMEMGPFTWKSQKQWHKSELLEKRHQHIHHVLWSYQQTHLCLIFSTKPWSWQRFLGDDSLFCTGNQLTINHSVTGLFISWCHYIWLEFNTQIRVNHTFSLIKVFLGKLNFCWIPFCIYIFWIILLLIITVINLQWSIRATLAKKKNLILWEWSHNFTTKKC